MGALSPFNSPFDEAVEGLEEFVGAFYVIDFRGLDGEAFSGGVLEVEDDGGGAGVAGDVVANFLKVFGGVAVGPEEEFHWAFAVDGSLAGFEFAEAASGEAATATAVVDLDADLEADDVAGLEYAGIAGGDE